MRAKHLKTGRFYQVLSAEPVGDGKIKIVFQFEDGLPFDETMTEAQFQKMGYKMFPDEAEAANDQTPGTKVG